MKKLLSIILLIMMSVIMTACIPSEDIELGDIEDIIIDEPVIIVIIEDPYSYDISDLPEYIANYTGDSSYTHISDWFITDYDLDGDVTEEELALSYEEMLEIFEYDHIVTLEVEVVSNMNWCIDETMDEEYINAATYAIEYYDEIDWIDTSWIIGSDCSSYNYTFTWITQEDLYDQLYESYIYEGYTELIADEMALGFSTNTIAFNNLSIDIENGEYDTLDTTNISFIVGSMEGMPENEMNFVALHEMTHSFGLDDIYDEAFIGFTIMYGCRDGQGELVPILRPFDLYNLALIYNIIEEDEGE